MTHVALTAVVALLALWLATPAFAFQCPKLVTEIQTKTAQRYDPTASAAKVSAVEAQRLHAAGQHAESEKLAKETLDKLK